MLIDKRKVCLVAMMTIMYMKRGEVMNMFCASLRGLSVPVPLIILSRTKFDCLIILNICILILLGTSYIHNFVNLL